MLWIGVQGKSHTSFALDDMRLLFLIVWLKVTLEALIFSYVIIDVWQIISAFSVWTIVLSNQLLCGGTPAFSRGRY
jgi:hypothetical protein